MKSQTVTQAVNGKTYTVTQVRKSEHRFFGQTPTKKTWAHATIHGIDGNNPDLAPIIKLALNKHGANVKGVQLKTDWTAYFQPYTWLLDLGNGFTEEWSAPHYYLTIEETDAPGPELTTADRVAARHKFHGQTPKGS